VPLSYQVVSATFHIKVEPTTLLIAFLEFFYYIESSMPIAFD